MEITGRIHELSAQRRERALKSCYSQILKVSTPKPYTLLLRNTRKLKSGRRIIHCKEQQQQQEEKHGRSLWGMINSIPEWADEIKERGMLQRRKLYDHEEWLRHRSSTRHIRHVLTSLSSRVILSLIPPVCVFTAIAAAVAAYNTAVCREWFPSFMPLLHTSSLPHQLTAPALALLLVFRTDASYSRYEEGRRTWTELLSGTKDFARKVSAWIRHPGDTSLKDDLLLYIMAFPVALKVGVLIEEPFPMLALDRMCELAHDNIREMIKLQNSIESHLHDKRTSFLDRSVSNGTGRTNRDASFKL